MSPLTLTLTSVLSALAFEHVRVEVGDGKVLENATVVVDGEKIALVGSGAAPAGATRIDGSGKTLTPGFIDLTSQLGLREVDLEPSTHDEALKNSVFSPAFKPGEGFNPLSVWIPVAREEGTTSAVLVPSGGVLSGLGSWVPLTGQLSTVADAARPLAMFGSVGTDGAGLTGGARGGLWLKLREVFGDARTYAKSRQAVQDNRFRALALPPLQLEALQGVLERKLPLVLEANRASDILAALRLAQEENLRLVITGGAEAHLVTGELKRAAVPVVLVPSAQVPSNFEQLHARDDSAARLDAAGVVLVLAAADQSHRRLRQEAGIAVAYGLPRARALATITSAPAKALGLETLGLVAPGKRADLVLWSGDPLELSTVAERVYIAGVEQPHDTRQSKLAQRYLGKVAAAKPAPPK
jgi:imidazolonepropionase-like amidohydrolase